MDSNLMNEEGVYFVIKKNLCQGKSLERECTLIKNLNVLKSILDDLSVDEVTHYLYYIVAYTIFTFIRNSQEFLDFIIGLCAAISYLFFIQQKKGISFMIQEEKCP